MGNNNQKKDSKIYSETFKDEDDFFKSPLALSFFGDDYNSNNNTGEIYENSTVSKSYQTKDFLGEYKDEFIIINLFRKGLIYDILKAINIKEYRNVSLKVYNKNKLKKGDYDYFIEQIKREEEIIKLCKCENILNIYRKIETNDYIIFEMESWDKNLADYMKEIGGFQNEMKIFGKIILGIATALKVLNENNIMHRDIKPSNLFFLKKDSLVKLSGFDYAIYIKDNTSESVGSIFYAAPEIIKNLEYDEKCDLWSLGINLYELLFLKLPYGKNVTINIIKHSICYEDNFCYDKTNSDEINYIFQNLLTLNRKNRINHRKFFDFLFKIQNIFNEFGNEYTSFKIGEVPKIFNLVQQNESNYYLNKNEFMNKIMNIVDEGLLPDIMEFPNGLIDSVNKFNNIIYYDENIKFIKSIKKDCDIFESKTPGAFIICTNLNSMTIIKEEIIRQYKRDKRKTFNLITTGSA